jgi:hypothetical protein
MDKCSKCGAETQLYENGNAICLKCSAEIEAARKRTAADLAERTELTDQDSVGIQK